jgi:hypothetical protein
MRMRIAVRAVSLVAHDGGLMTSQPDSRRNSTHEHLKQQQEQFKYWMFGDEKFILSPKFNP